VIVRRIGSGLHRLLDLLRRSNEMCELHSMVLGESFGSFGLSIALHDHLGMITLSSLDVECRLVLFLILQNLESV
jgi:hypothetical protein